jgi:signal recognition particle subunit SRP54
VIIDTAGRLGVDAEMMAQAAAIRDAVDPDEILFVVDSMIGQDAVTTAQAFEDGVGFDGVVLTKLDGDARGGAALSIAQVTGRPIMFASNGEKLEDFDLFHPDRMASRILDLGDILTLIEQAERNFDQQQAAEMASKLVSAEGFTLQDFVEQLAMVRKLGPISNLLGMLPGAAQNREMLSQISDKDLDRAAAIVSSMTPEERRNPKILNGSRRLRIAGGAGVTVGEVNSLVVRFLEGQKVMRQMMGGMRGMPGMPGLPGAGGRRGGQKAKGKKKGKGGGRPASAGASAGRPGGRQGDPAGAGLAGIAALSDGAGVGGDGTGGAGGVSGLDMSSLGMSQLEKAAMNLPPGLRKAAAGGQGSGGLSGVLGRRGGGPAGPPSPPGTGKSKGAQGEEDQQLPPGLRGRKGR